MTLNGVMAISLRDFSEFGSFRGYVKSGLLAVDLLIVSRKMP